MNNTAVTVRDLTPPPGAVRARMGELYRELRLLRRLKRLAEQARQSNAPADAAKEGLHDN